MVDLSINRKSFVEVRTGVVSDENLTNDVDSVFDSVEDVNVIDG